VFNRRPFSGRIREARLGAEYFVFQFIIQKCKINVHKTMILPVVLYGCETWSLTLREEYTITVFENRVLRRKFGPKRDEVAGERRRLHNEELHVVYSSPNVFKVIKSRKMRWTVHVARMVERIDAYRVLLGNLREGDHLEDPG
jgi:hypothetical protein